MVDRQQTVGHGINVCLCVLCVSAVELVVSRLIFLQMETDDCYPLSIPVKIKAIIGDLRTIATRYRVIVDLDWPAEETRNIRVVQQFGEIAGAHL